MVLGLGILASGTYGFAVFMEQRKEVRLEELRTDERKAVIEALQFANARQVELSEKILETMKHGGE